MVLTRTIDRDRGEDMVQGARIEIAWQFGVMMGSPLYRISGTYVLPPPERRRAILYDVEICDPRAPGGRAPQKGRAEVSAAQIGEEAFLRARLGSQSRFRAHIAADVATRFEHGSVFFDFFADTLVEDGGAGAGLSVPTARRWAEVFQTRRSGEDVWLSEEAAKRLYRDGVRIERIELTEVTYLIRDLRFAYEAWLDETCPRIDPPKSASADPAQEEEAQEAAKEEATDGGSVLADRVRERLRRTLAGASTHAPISATIDPPVEPVAMRASASVSDTVPAEQPGDALARAQIEEEHAAQLAWCSTPPRRPSFREPLVLHTTGTLPECNEACRRMNENLRLARENHRRAERDYPQVLAEWERRQPTCIADAERERRNALERLDAQIALRHRSMGNLREALGRAIGQR